MSRRSNAIRPYFVLNKKGRYVAMIEQVFMEYKEGELDHNGKPYKAKGFYIWHVKGLDGWTVYNSHIKVSDAITEAKGNGYRVDRMEGKEWPQYDNENLNRLEWLHFDSYRETWKVWNSELSKFIPTHPRRSGSL